MHGDIPSSAQFTWSILRPNGSKTIISPDSSKHTIGDTYLIVRDLDKDDEGIYHCQFPNLGYNGYITTNGNSPYTCVIVLGKLMYMSYIITTAQLGHHK